MASTSCTLPAGARFIFSHGENRSVPVPPVLLFWPHFLSGQIGKSSEGRPLAYSPDHASRLRQPVWPVRGSIASRSITVRSAVLLFWHGGWPQPKSAMPTPHPVGMGVGKPLFDPLTRGSAQQKWPIKCPYVANQMPLCGQSNALFSRSNPPLADYLKPFLPCACIHVNGCTRGQQNTRVLAFGDLECPRQLRHFLR